MSKKKDKKAGSKNPAYPTADPTAPGGMSQKALVAEMVKRHGWKEKKAKALKWPEQIDAVVQGRLAEEKKAKKKAGKKAAPAEAAPVEVAEHDTSWLKDKATTAEEITTPAAATVYEPEDGTYNYMLSGHSGVGPSASERWLSCTGSLALSREFLETLTPNQMEEFATSEVAARQGTTAHAAAEAKALNSLGRISDEELSATLTHLALAPLNPEEAFDEEMDEYIGEYLNLIDQYTADRGAENVLIEHRVSAPVVLVGAHSEEVYEVKGSADMVALPGDGNELVVADLKYGSGVDVGVEANPQARLYGFGVLASLADEDGNIPESLTTITYHIVQPRLGGIKTWSESVEDLIAWINEDVAPALTAALYDEVETPSTFAPSESACQWCPARGMCAALAETRMTEAAEAFDTALDIEVKHEDAVERVGALSDERLGTLLLQIEGVVKLKDEMKAEAQRRLYRGVEVPGYKLVSYTPPRSWKDNEEAIKRIKFMRKIDKEQKDALMKPPALVTPTQAEKILGEDYEHIVNLIDVPDKRPVAARENDRRKTWDGRAPEEMFPEIEAGSDG